MSPEEEKPLLKDRLADSMLGVGLAIAFFFWAFSALIRFLGTSRFDASGGEFELYDRLVVLCLFILFGSHVQLNIRKRRTAEETLRLSEEKYRNILESIQEGYYEIDLDGRFTFTNPSLCSILALNREQLLGMALADFIDGDGQREFLVLQEQVRSDPAFSSTIECECVIRSGVRQSRRILELSVSLISQAPRQPTGYRGIVRDITERKMLERNLIQSLQDVKEARAGIILGLAKLAEHRDTDTGSHLERIREYAQVIANDLRNHSIYKDYITSEYIEDIYHSSILHDIGKVGVPDAILLKPGRLTAEEFQIIKKHSLLGGKVLSDIEAQFQNRSFLTIAKEIAFYHHERWDGTGYPSGMKRHQIPLSARIVAIADVYDALTSKRCYKEAYTHDEAREIIKADREKAFDPDIVDAFLAHEDEFRRIRTTLHDGIPGESGA